MKKEKKLTPMLKQFLDVKNQHKDKIILFRMGDFYETFFDDAKITSKVLGITLTSRNKKDDDAIPLAGFPYHALDNYLDKLVNQGHKVVICEQVEDPKKAKGIVKRDIVDIITPGSIVDHKLLSSPDNNYLMAIVKHPKKNRIGMANLDVSTGDFIFTELDLDLLSAEIHRLQPAEIIYFDDTVKHILDELTLPEKAIITSLTENDFDLRDAKEILKNQFGSLSLEGIGVKNKPLGALACAFAVYYVKSLKRCELNHISACRFYTLDNYMQLDESTRRNLELTQSMRYNSRFGSLISVLDETKTPMGARLLKSWLTNPLINPKDIEERLNIVSAFHNAIHFAEEIRTILTNIGDLSRLISKAGAQRINPREIITLCHYLQTAPNLKDTITNFKEPILDQFIQKIEDYNHIVDRITKSIQENPPIVITEGNIISDGYHEELDSLRNISRDGKTWIARLETEEKKQTGIPSLKIGYNKVFGYYLEVTKTHKDKIPEHYIRKQTLVNSERYISPKLKEYEAKVLGAEERIKNLEYELFIDVRTFLFEQVVVMQKFVNLIAELDVFTNLATIAYQKQYVRPRFNKEKKLHIVEGRHPVIEALLTTEEFIPNDVSLDDDEYKIALITGPNMAGKSTYLRQIGLIAIMAQIGSYVPAKEANIPVFDKVFTRVGASDNLAMGQSTFLVEMLETANILNAATPESLVLLDEIGRGTSTFDGLSLAWSIVEYIHDNKNLNCKTLFATHYHELTELENILRGVKNFNIAVREYNDEMIFLRKIERGGADQSYGIQVARLAGVPQKVIRRAKKILRNLEAQELSPQGFSKKMQKDAVKEEDQMDLFDLMFQQAEEDNEILSEIKDININDVTPMQALQLISEWKKKI